MAQIPPLNSRCYVNKAGAAGLCAPKCHQAGPLLQIAQFWQCHESRGQGWSPCGLIPPWCLWPAFPWHCWVRGSQLRGKCTALWITLLMSAADVSISLPYLVTVMKAVVLQACLNTRERWIFILPARFLLSCVSLSGLPSHLFWGALVTKAPSILLLQRMDCGRKRSCLKKLCQTGWWWYSHLRSSPKRGRATWLSILPVFSVPLGSLHKVDHVSRARVSAFFRSRLDTIGLVNMVWWVVYVRKFWALFRSISVMTS